MGSPALGVSLRHLHLQMRWGERGLSWAQVVAAGSPGQRVEVALEAQVVSGLEAGWTLHLPLTLERQGWALEAV